MDPSLMDSFISALTHKQWPLVAGFVIVFLVHFANKAGLKDKVGAKYVPWVALGLGMLLSIGSSLMGGTPVADVLQTGLLSGGLATAFWELALKDMLGIKPVVVAAGTLPAATPVVEAPAATVVVVAPSVEAPVAPVVAAEVAVTTTTTTEVAPTPPVEVPTTV